MDNVELWLLLIGNGILSLLKQPLLYLSVLFLLMMYMYRTKMERAMFSVKLEPWQKPFLSSLASGIVLAIIVSLISILLGFTVTIATIWWLWGVSVLLLMFKMRFVNVVYSAGIVALLHLSATLIGPLSLSAPQLQAMYDSLLAVEVNSLLIIASILAVGQAILVKIQGNKFLSPIYLSGKRGKLIGGYVMQAYWCTPLLLFMPVANDTKLAVSFVANSVQPYFLQADAQSWLLLAAPMMLATTGVTFSTSPEAFVARIFKQRLLVSVILLAISLLAWWFNLLTWVAAAALIIGFELVHLVNRWYESRQAPRYGSLDQGLRVLAIVKNSPAVHMGIVPGDTIKKANGMAVHSLEQLYEAMSINPAFCKLEIINTDGEIKFAQRARYSDEHHQLGIILAPDHYSKYLEQYREPSCWTLFSRAKMRSYASSIVQDKTTAV